METEEKFLLNVPEAAELLRVQPNTLRFWLSKNMVLPPELLIHLGRRVLFSKEKMLKWIENGCKTQIYRKEEGKNG